MVTITTIVGRTRWHLLASEDENGKVRTTCGIVGRSGAAKRVPQEQARHFVTCDRCQRGVWLDVVPGET